MRVARYIVTLCLFFMLPVVTHAAVQFIGSATGTNNAVYPAGTQAGDFILGFASRDSALTGSVPSGWTLLEETSHVLGSGNNIWTRFAFRYAGAETSSGNFSSADNLIIQVYRGTRTDYSSINLPNFNTAVNNGSSNNVVYPALSLVYPGSSYLAWVVAQDNGTASGLATVGTGMTNRGSRSNSGNALAGHDSNGVTTNSSARTVNVGSASAARTYTLEIGDSSTSTAGMITIANATTTTNGFQGYAYHNTGATSTIAIHATYPQGFGVSGTLNGATGDTTEIGANSSGLSERLIINFDQPVATATVQFAWLAPGEVAIMALYDSSGTFLATTTFSSGTDEIDAPFLIDIGQPFSRIQFSAAASNDYLVNNIVYHTTVVPPPSVISYVNSTEPALTNGGRIGQTITVSGSNFGSACNASNYITIGSYQVPCANVTAWSSTSTTFTIPSGITVSSGNLVVTTTNGSSSGVAFVVYPSVTSVAAVGTNAAREYAVGDTDGLIQLIGTQFGTTSGTVLFSWTGGSATGTIHNVAEGSCTVAGWASTTVCVEVPTSIPDGVGTTSVTLIRSGGATSSAPTLTLLPRVTNLSPSPIAQGGTLTITGSHFCQGTCPGSLSVINNVLFGTSTGATFVSWTSSQIVVTMPPALTGTSTVSVLASSLSSNGIALNAVPPPTLSFSAATSTVPLNGTTTLNWSTTNANTCTASGAWSGSKATSGAQSVGPIASTSNFVLTCVGIAGTSTATVTVAVVGSPTLTFSAATTTLLAGGTTTLTWSAGNVSSCTASGAWSGSKSATGTQVVGPLSTSSSFTLSCTNITGTVTSTVAITVYQLPTLSLAASSTTLYAGNATNLSWASTNTTGCSASGGWSGARAVAGTESSGTLSATTTFTLACTGPGGTATSSVTINVIPIPTITSISAAGTNAAREYTGSNTDGLIQLNGSAFGVTAGTIVFDWGTGSTTGTIHNVAQGSCTVAGWASTTVCVEVPTSIPDNIATVTVRLIRAGDAQVAIAPTLTLLPTITNIAPPSAAPGDTITITGSHLCQGTCPTSLSVLNNVLFGSSTIPAGSLISWTATQILVTVPSGLTPGVQPLFVVSQSQNSNTLNLTVLSTVPNDPSLGSGSMGSATEGQFDTDGAITIGDATGETTVTFKGTLSAQVNTNLALEVEVKPIGSAFDGTGTTVGSAVAYSGTPVTGTVAVSGLSDGNYHWRVRAVNTNTSQASNWVAFGGNPVGDGSGDGSPATTDFSVVTAGPSITGVGTPPNCLAHSQVHDTSAQLSWFVSSSLPPSGITNFVSFGTSTNLVASSTTQGNNGLTPVVTLTGLLPETTYYYLVRSIDGLGHVSEVPTSTPFCQFTTEPASKRINKLSEYYICQAKNTNENWSGGSGVTCASGDPGAKLFNIFTSEHSLTHPITQLSAFVEVFGVADASSDFTVTVSVNGETPRTTTIKNPTGSIPWRVLYPVENGFNLDYPGDTSASNLLDVQVNGADEVSSIGAKATLTYYYFPF